MNRAARLILRLPKRAHITPHLRRLHWLPIGPRIDYKVILLTHKALSHMQPEFLSHLLPLSDRSGLLQHVASIGGHRISERSFRFSASRLFNPLPAELRRAVCTETFKRKLKTFLFGSAYDHLLDSLLHYVPSSDFIMSRS